MRKLFITFLLFPLLVFSQESSLSFETAYQRTLTQSPTLKISQANIDATSGSLLQSSLYPNPILSVEVEDIGGYGGWNGVKNSDSTIAISQLIELGSKRNLRMNIATYDYSAAVLDYEITKLQILNAFKKAFIKVYATQENWKLAQKRRTIANEVYKLVTNKVEAGKVSIIQQTKAQIDLSNAEINYEQTNLEFQTAKETLSAIWGSCSPDFDYVEYPFYSATQPLSYQDCKNSIVNNPHLVQAQLYYCQAQEKIRLEKSYRIPDVVVTAGYEVEPGCGGLVLGVSLPLPVFDRNQGSIAGAFAESIKAEHEITRTQLLLENTLSLAYKKLVNAYKSVSRLDESILLFSRQALKLAQEGYKEGKFDYLEVLDSQRTYFDVESQYINALVDYHLAQADIEYLHSQTE